MDQRPWGSLCLFLLFLLFVFISLLAHFICISFLKYCFLFVVSTVRDSGITDSLLDCSELQPKPKVSPTSLYSSIAINREVRRLSGDVSSRDAYLHVSPGRTDAHDEEEHCDGLLDHRIRANEHYQLGRCWLASLRQVAAVCLNGWLPLHAGPFAAFFAGAAGATATTCPQGTASRPSTAAPRINGF